MFDGLVTAGGGWGRGRRRMGKGGQGRGVGKGGNVAQVQTPPLVHVHSELIVSRVDEMVQHFCVLPHTTG